MIKGVISVGPYLKVGSYQTPYINMNTPSSGMMRYNGNTSSVEIYDGSYWQQIHTLQDINLTPQANEILDWAKNKMQEEKLRTMLATTHPAVAAALENLKRAEEQLVTIIHLSTENEKTTS